MGEPLCVRENCDHQYYDSSELELDGPAAQLFNFCPWCGISLRKEAKNDTLQRTNGRTSQEQP